MKKKFPLARWGTCPLCRANVHWVRHGNGAKDYFYTAPGHLCAELLKAGGG